MESPPNAWCVYLVRCQDGSLYCGIAKDLTRRLAEHNSPDKGAKYTRGRRPVELVYAEKVSSRAHATQREGQIKRLNRTQKKLLIDSKANHIRASLT